MRLIVLVIVLALIGFLVNKQLNSSSAQKQLESAIGEQGIDVPKVPSSPEDLKKFEKDLNNFVKNDAKRRAKELEKEAGN